MESAMAGQDRIRVDGDEHANRCQENLKAASAEIEQLHARLRVVQAVKYSCEAALAAYKEQMQSAEKMQADDDSADY